MIVHLETGCLSDGSHVVRSTHGDEVRAVYDPDQLTEAEALVHLCVRVPDLIRRGFQVRHAAHR